MNILILDYGMGNIQSMVRKIQHFGTPVAASSPEAIEASDKIILPGVGHFGRAMEFLKEKHLIAPLNAAVIEHKKPILGVCLGMQLMTTRSEEGNVDGLGWIDAEVRQFRVQDNFKFKVPHVGWNKAGFTKESILTQGIPEDNEFYFVHSYYVQCEQQSDVLTTSHYALEFDSAFQKGNIYGTQFHPEKSLDFGMKMLQNFVQFA